MQYETESSNQCNLIMPINIKKITPNSSMKLYQEGLLKIGKD